MDIPIDLPERKERKNSRHDLAERRAESEPQESEKHLHASSLTLALIFPASLQGAERNKRDRYDHEENGVPPKELDEAQCLLPEGLPLV